MLPARRALSLRPRELYQQANSRERAREHLATATTQYREMDMRFWLEQAEVESRGLA